MAQPIDLCTLDAARLAGNMAWWTLYRTNFPDAEREAERVLLDTVAIGRSIAVEARQNGGTVGIAHATLLRDPPVVFLSYIATAPRAEGGGIGGALLAYVWSEGAQALANSGHLDACLIGEVEMPALAERPEDLARRERRVRFFCKHGGIALSRIYYQPPLSGVEAISLHLIYFDNSGRGEPDAERQDQVVRAIYRERYEMINKVDRRVLDELLQRPS